MAAGTPNWEKVGGQLIAQNNALRKSLGLEPREDAVPNWQRIIEEVRKENKKFSVELEKRKEVLVEQKAAKRVKVKKSKTTGKKKED